MLAKIVEFFQAEMRPEYNTALNDEQKRLACAALLIEVAIVDNEFDADEIACLRNILHNSFGISQAQSEAFITLAHNECADSSSMYQFTQLINQHCNAQDKFDLIKGMWCIAYADGELDKYEEYVIRKVADLIYVSHGDFIRAKIASRSAL